MVPNQTDEPTSLHRLIRVQSDGASRFGTHFLKDWLCEAFAAYKYLLPHPDGGQGIVRMEAVSPLEVGKGYHTGLERLYESRCKTGEDNGQWDLEWALHMVEQDFVVRRDKWQDEAQWAADRDMSLGLVRRYNDHYGPNGADYEWPKLKVYCDDTGPWIEREVVVPLDWHGLEFTCRIDLVVEYLGTVRCMEHKTAAPSGVYKLVRDMELAAQPAAEILAARHAGLPQVNGIILNVCNKKPAKKDDGAVPKFLRELLHRTDDDLAKFKLDVVQQLVRVWELLDRYEHLTSQGIDPYEAIRRVFVQTGRWSGKCSDYQRQCDYWHICGSTGREHNAVRGFKPRVREQED